MTAFPRMTPPSALTTTLFVAIVLGLAALLVLAVARARPPGESPKRHRAWVLGTAAGAILWLAVTGAAARSGLLERKMLPPPVMFLVFPSLVIAARTAFSPLGTRLVGHVSTAALIGFQAFRLPLEMVLHAWWKEGVLPIQMTFEGHNFDIVTGSLALGLGLWGAFRPLPRAVVLGFNLIGTALLAAVMVIAILSAPLPIRQYTNDPPVLLPYNFPYVWIVPFCVGGALFGHLLLFRRLAGRSGPTKGTEIA